MLLSLSLLTGCNSSVKNTVVGDKKEDKKEEKENINDAEDIVEDNDDVIVVQEDAIDENTIEPVDIDKYYQSLPLYEKKEAVYDPGKIKITYEVDTSVTYSSGEESDWSYGNQRKEFPILSKTYARIGSANCKNCLV